MAALQVPCNDATGASCFSDPEAARASEHLAALRFVEKVQACLQRKRFDVPQQSAAVSANFCNESVYGNLNVLCVNGVVRLDATDEASDSDSDCDTFDVWPSALSNALTSMQRDEYIADMAAAMGGT